MWRILYRQMEEQSAAVTNIVKAVTVLHNFVIIREPHRLNVNAMELPEPQLPEHRRPLTYDRIENHRHRSTKNALNIREKLKNYFTHEGAVSWQNEYS